MTCLNLVHHILFLRGLPLFEVIGVLRNADEEDWKTFSGKTGVRMNSTALFKRPSKSKRSAIDDVIELDGNSVRYSAPKRRRGT